MTPRTANEIRDSFLGFFTERGHTLVASASLVPENDPTLLFTGAGMNQFKDLFVGRGEKPYSRATSSQKCFRTGDLEQVGRSMNHHTFFEMLGNFSFGDYFKKEAIHWAWEYLTEVLGLPGERLSATVYTDDDEAYGIWTSEIGLPEERVTRLGAKANFWPANAPEDGPNGVCGPCSEIFWDYGEEYSCGEDCRKEDCDCARYSEVYNLVFTQFLRTGKNQLEPLPQTNIDTGLGFERLVAVLGGKLSTFQTDLFLPILDRIGELTGIGYSFDAPEGERMRRIADHVRAAAFCLVDGVKPGREGREFVLRRVIRRAVRDGITLGLDRPFLDRLVPGVVAIMGSAYPEIEAGAEDVAYQVRREEERFRSTYAAGMNTLTEAVRKLVIEGGRVLPGEVAFRLHDERGFPIDLTEDYLREEGLTLDRAGFDKAMQDRRRQSRSGSAIEADIFARGPVAEVRAEHGTTEFTGYAEPTGRGEILALIRGDDRVRAVAAGEEVLVVTDRTPFYAESGGQVGDGGRITGPAGAVVVTDTRSAEGVTTMIGTVESGSLSLGEAVLLEVDAARRDAIRRNHTATHLLHAALRNHLGADVRQAGSLVAPDRLRFDFHHDGAMQGAQVAAVEAEVNGEILANTALATEVMPYDQARETGAMALFGEKYGDDVRVVSVGDFSKELCGGTHCARTGEVGPFRIVYEGSIGSGIRRVEALTGEGALRQMDRDRRVLGRLGELLRVPAEDLPARVDALRDEIRELTKKLDRALSAKEGGGPELDRVTLDNGIVIVSWDAGDPYEMKHLLEMADRIRAEDGAVAFFLTAASAAGVEIVLGGTDALLAAGFDAGKAIKAATGAMGGGGGGRKDLARGKGKDASARPEALNLLSERLKALDLS